MNVLSVNEFIVRADWSLKEALQVIDNNAQGICFVVNDSGKLVGVITDGDIRRALLKFGAETHGKLASDVMSAAPKKVDPGTSVLKTISGTLAIVNLSI